MEEEQKAVEAKHEQNERQQLEESMTDIPVVRTNTPRPLTFETLIAQSGQGGQNEYVGWQYEAKRPADESLSVFPHEAPVAPPVPEEVDEQEESTGTDVVVESTPLPLAPSVTGADVAEHEFVWLFEYGMEMDATLLNSTDRLNAAALLFGPAVLKGYTLAFAVVETQRQKVVATITSSSAAGAEVWGIVYRIPRRLLEQEGDEASQLDRVHGATPPDNLYERVEVVVSEAYRGRELRCLTYIAVHVPQITAAQVTDREYLHRLLEIVKNQQLPEDYRQSLAVSDARMQVSQPPHPEQDTEPLPVVGEKASLSAHTESEAQVEHMSQIEQVEQVQPAPSVSPVPSTPFPQSHATGLLVFACFSGMMLLVALVLAVMQGLGLAGTTFTEGFAPLNVPWYVLLYGLIGGSSSCLVTLGRRYARYYEQAKGDMPVFVVIVWCCRPLIGVVLAMLSYLLLNTGLFALVGNASQHVMLSSLLAVLSGFCEGWLFKRQWA